MYRKGTRTIETKVGRYWNRLDKPFPLHGKLLCRLSLVLIIDLNVVVGIKNNTASDLFSGHGYSGNDGFSGTKTPDDAILFTVSGITVLVELFWKILMWI